MQDYARSRAYLPLKPVGCPGWTCEARGLQGYMREGPRPHSTPHKPSPWPSLTLNTHHAIRLQFVRPERPGRPLDTFYSPGGGP